MNNTTETKDIVNFVVVALIVAIIIHLLFNTKEGYSSVTHHAGSNSVVEKHPSYNIHSTTPGSYDCADKVNYVPVTGSSQTKRKSKEIY